MRIKGISIQQRKGELLALLVPLCNQIPCVPMYSIHLGPCWSPDTAKVRPIQNSMPLYLMMKNRRCALIRDSNMGRLNSPSTQVPLAFSVYDHRTRERLNSLFDDVTIATATVSLCSSQVQTLSFLPFSKSRLIFFFFVKQSCQNVLFFSKLDLQWSFFVCFSLLMGRFFTYVGGDPLVFMLC